MNATLTRAAITVGLLLSSMEDTFADFVVEEDKIAFYAAHPGLSIETFETAVVDANSQWVFDGPISASTNNAVFSPGSVLDGIEIRTLERISFTNFDTSQFAALGTGFGGSASKSVAVSDTRTGTDKISIVFDDPQTVIGIDLAAVNLLSGQFFVFSNILVDVFSDPSREDSRIGGAFIGVSGTDGGFFGVLSDRPFARMILVSLTAHAAPVIDNVAFGAIPEPDAFAQLLLFGFAIANLHPTRRYGVRDTRYSTALHSSDESSRDVK
jgi:hypothetical protein